MAKPGESGYVLPPCAERGRWRRLRTGPNSWRHVTNCHRDLREVSPSACRACMDDQITERKNGKK